jgi:hypothetical protein
MTCAGRKANLDAMNVGSRKKLEVFVGLTAAGRKYAVELIGTCFVVFVVGVAVISGNLFVPLTIGASLMVMTYAGGPVSGGHYNPAVTMAALVRGRIGLRDATGYWITQFAGGLVAYGSRKSRKIPGISPLCCQFPVVGWSRLDGSACRGITR